ncbi:metalloendopeptidase PEX [Caerostris extrusa]|uniref:Metalloendopeptidase PEX n=1 Tax=Caerostris extrusa TaxID=172846 RepID=A0AAV4UE12_CAEEX|nr:metalloendopeptidase PEX [Caerostris extrusa]
MCFFFDNGKSSGSSSVEGKPGCWNTNCIKTAGEMLSLIDDQFDPCTNFYEYSCGSFSQALGQSAYQNSIDSVYFSVKDFLENSTNSESEDLENLKSFYGRCMEFEGLHSKREDTAKLFLELMERFGIGGWPVLDEFESQLSLSEILSALTLVGVPVAYRVEVVPDNRIDGSYLLKISPGGPLESGRSGTDIRGDQDLKTYMLFSFLLLGASTYSKATRAVDDILGVDAYYANVEQDTESKCDTIDMLAPDESLNRLNSMIPEDIYFIKSMNSIVLMNDTNNTTLICDVIATALMNDTNDTTLMGDAIAAAHMNDTNGTTLIGDTIATALDTTLMGDAIATAHD